MPRTVFLSWQSDRPNAVGRTMIEASLAEAIKALDSDAEIRPADRDIAIDRDTLGVPGTPAIADTIYRKIDRATVFVSDLTYVAIRPKGGGIPNPNVSVEHGWALKALGPRRVISVMNTAFGHPREHELPFDLRHVKWPILYECAAGADPEARAGTRKQLTRMLTGALKAIFTDEATMAELLPAAPAVPHPHDLELLGRIHRQLPPGLRRFLHEHSFITPFRIAILDPIHEMNDGWLGAAYEFHDVVLQEAFTAIRKASQELGSLVLERIFPEDRDQRTGTSRTDVDRAEGLQSTTREGIRAMDAKAAELAQAIDAFDRLARDRIRVASGAHAEPVGTANGEDRIEAARRGLEELAGDAGRGGVPQLVSIPRLTLRLVPFAALPGRRLDPRLAAEAQLRFPPSVDERVKADADGTQWWSCAVPHRRPGLANPETTWLMRLVRPGRFEYQVQAGERIDDDPGILIDGRNLEAAIVHNLERMGAMAAGLGLDGPALASITLEGMENVELTRARPGGRRIRRPAIILPPVEIEDLEAPLAAALHEQFDMMWQASGWIDGSRSFDGGTWAGYVNPAVYGRA